MYFLWWQAANRPMKMPVAGRKPVAQQRPSSTCPTRGPSFFAKRLVPVSPIGREGRQGRTLFGVLQRKTLQVASDLHRQIGRLRIGGDELHHRQGPDLHVLALAELEAGILDQSSGVDRLAVDEVGKMAMQPFIDVRQQAGMFTRGH